MNKPSQSSSSNLFTVRLWREDMAEGRTEIRGRVQHVLSGEVRYFRDWSALIVALNAMLAHLEGNGEASQQT